MANYGGGLLSNTHKQKHEKHLRFCLIKNQVVHCSVNETKLLQKEFNYFSERSNEINSHESSVEIFGSYLLGNNTVEPAHMQYAEEDHSTTSKLEQPFCLSLHSRKISFYEYDEKGVFQLETELKSLLIC